MNFLSCKVVVGTAKWESFYCTVTDLCQSCHEWKSWYKKNSPLPKENLYLSEVTNKIFKSLNMMIIHREKTLRQEKFLFPARESTSNQIKTTAYLRVKFIGCINKSTLQSQCHLWILTEHLFCVCFYSMMFPGTLLFYHLYIDNSLCFVVYQSLLFIF